MLWVSISANRLRRVSLRSGGLSSDVQQPSAICWRRGTLWLGGPVLTLCACVTPYSDEPMTCPDEYRGQTVAEIVAELDVTGDGVFDEHDVERGESVLLFRFVQADGEERLVVSRDEHCGMNMYIYGGGGEYPWGERSLFGPWHEFTECSAFGWSTLWFFNERAEDLELQTGTGDLYHLAFDIAEIEHGNISIESEVDGWMHTVVEDNRRSSGHLEGSASTDIISYFTQEPTGERAEIIAQAFRDLPVSH
jgi:hypothetical protein